MTTRISEAVVGGNLDFSILGLPTGRKRHRTQRMRERTDASSSHPIEALTIGNPCRMDTHSVRAEIGLARMSDLHSPSINRHRRQDYVTDAISTTYERQCHHVLNRANGRLKIFKAARDFAAFEAVLAEGAERFRMRVCGYCLMSTHWHLVLWLRGDGDLSAFMKWVTATHSHRWHTAHKTVGIGHLYDSLKNKDGDKFPPPQHIVKGIAVRLLAYFSGGCYNIYQPYRHLRLSQRLNICP